MEVVAKKVSKTTRVDCLLCMEFGKDVRTIEKSLIFLSRTSIQVLGARLFGEGTDIEYYYRFLVYMDLSQWQHKTIIYLGPHH